MSPGTSLRDQLEDNTAPSAPALVVAEAGQWVRCLACGHRCRIPEGNAGACRVRFNRGGQLRVPDGYVSGLQIDPIEKKPFYHAFPGRDALSIGMLGCNFHCGYCQNWITSQALRDDRAGGRLSECSPADLVRLAVENRVPVIVSTYNEPLISADWAVKVFAPAREQGIRCGFVSNGYATPEVLAYLRPHMDFFKVDLKSFHDRHYRKLGGVLKNVLASIETMKKMDFWLEIVTLVVPTFNDSDQELGQIAAFIAGVSPDIPWHVTAFHPDYRMAEPPRTPAATLVRAYEIGREAGLRYVYAGNLAGAVGGRENTDCPHCGEVLIRRRGFLVERNIMTGDQCPQCGGTIAGVWEDQPPRRSTGTGFPRGV
jgi:pyruvate formate lyase activating enzyme